MRIDYQSNPLLSPITAADSGIFTLGKNDLPARLVATGLAGAEAVTLVTVDGPANIETAVFKDGMQVKLTATNPGFGINTPGPYKWSKGVTAGASGIFLAHG